jgi:hypothetical protein
MSEAAVLPPALQLRSRRRIIDDATQGLGSARGAHLSIRGGRFRLINANGVEKLVDTHYVDVVLIDANDKPARIYFEGAYEPDSDVPPVCWSDNGVGPSTQAMVPQAPTCQMCPNNIRGTKQTFTGKPTTACENRKKLAFIVPDDPAINVYEFQIPPGSLSNFRDYCKWLDTQASGVEGRAMDVADVVTRVAFDPDKQFVMTFTAVAFADDDQTMQLIQHIDDNHLSDAAVGRNDVACDPEQVKAMIAGRPAQAALAAPNQGAKEAQAVQQRQLPQRTAPAGGQEVIPPKPRGRGANRPALPGAETTQAAAAAPAAPTAAAHPSNGNGTDPGIPSFLRRNADNTAPAAPAAAPAPKFGVGRAPPPPAEISDTLNKAMALPTRRG